MHSKKLFTQEVILAFKCKNYPFYLHKLYIMLIEDANNPSQKQ